MDAILNSEKEIGELKIIGSKNITKVHNVLKKRLFQNSRNCFFLFKNTSWCTLFACYTGACKCSFVKLTKANSQNCIHHVHTYVINLLPNPWS